MKTTNLIWVIVLLTNTVFAQIEFAFNNDVLHLVNHLHFPETVVHDAPVQTEDPLEVRLFKGYFNPGSYLAYQKNFVPGEMPPISLSEFQEWQDLLRTDRLYLHDCIEVKDNFGNHYLVFQYIMDNPEFMYYHSLIMKKIGQQWKHINFEKDDLAAPLKKIGQLKMDCIEEAMRTPDKSIDLTLIPPIQIRKSFEKFDRQHVFNLLKPAFQNIGMDSIELNKAKDIFLADRDGEMLFYISETYHIDYISLVKLVNETCGFNLLKFSNGEVK